VDARVPLAELGVTVAELNGLRGKVRPDWRGDPVAEPRRRGRIHPSRQAAQRRELLKGDLLVGLLRPVRGEVADGGHGAHAQEPGAHVGAGEFGRFVVEPG